jgi:hypothetical protein
VALAVAIVVALASAGDLPFEVTPTPRLKIAGRVSDTLVLTPSGRHHRPDSREPVCIVGHAAGETHPDGLRSLAELHLRRNTRMTDIKNFDGGPVVVSGVEGYELTADARDLKTRAQMRVYQAVVPGRGGHFTVRGLVAADQAAELVAEFRRVAQSLRATPVGR